MCPWPSYGPAMFAPLRLTWQHTWPRGGADFTVEFDDGFLRVYKRVGINDRGTGWLWVASRGAVIGKGLAESKHAACAAAEACWFGNAK